MKNCLVTKLKESVGNDSLSKLGILHLKISSAASGQTVANGLRIYMKTGTFGTITATGEGYFNSDQTSKQINSPSTFTFSNGNYYIDIDNKYNISGIMTINGYVNMEFDIADLAYCKDILYMDVYNSNVFGNLVSLKNANLANLSDILISNTKISGNIKYLAFPSVTSISFNDIVEGNLVEFVETCIERGRTSRSTSERINVGNLINYPKIKFGQTSIQAKGVCCLTWESVSKIVLYVGGDPNPAAGGNYHTVYAKGATAEEIAAWEQAGKTVVVVS